MKLLLKSPIVYLLLGQPVAAETDERTATELIAALKQGGYVIYMRHTTTQRDDKSRDQKNLAFSIAKNQAESRRLGLYLHRAMLNANLDKGNVVFVGHTANGLLPDGKK